MKELGEENLRPRRWDEYLGQEKIKHTLRIIIDAARARGEPLDHLLFYGSPGLGKTTLAHVIANELGASIKTCAGPSLEKTGDIASLLTNLQEGDILFLDECHRMQKPVMEMFYSALEDFKLHVIIGRGPMARTVEIDLPRFTLIGATTRIALLPSPFRNRFGAIFQLQFYTQEEIKHILDRSSLLLRFPAEEEALWLISSRSRSTPRIANRLFKRVRDFATVEGLDRITKEIAQKAFSFLEIDELGLESADRRILEVLIQKFDGRPIGIRALAAAVSEEEDTLLDLYEPYLLQLGLLERTPRGRVATSRARQHLSHENLATSALKTEGVYDKRKMW